MRQVDVDPVAIGDLGLLIEFEAANAQPRLGLAGRAPQQRLQPRDDLLGAGRFHDIIVRPRIEPDDLLLPAAARRQDQDRCGYAAAPRHANELDSVDAGQANVDDQRRKQVQRGPRQRVLRRRDMLNGEPRQGEAGEHALGQVGIIFDEQKLHVPPIVKLPFLHFVQNDRFTTGSKRKLANGKRQFRIES